MQVTDAKPSFGIEDPEPSLEQKLQEAGEATSGRVPLIPAAPDSIVDLPRGRFINKRWETEAEVRELTGNDEEALARFKDPETFFNGVIVYGTARIGSQDLGNLPFADRSALLEDLLLGEREQLFLNIAKVTYGDEKKITHTCPFCNTEADTTLVISEDIKFQEMTDVRTLMHTLVTGKGHTLTYRLATGADQMTVLSRKGASLAEQNTTMISLCVLEIDGGPVVDPLGMARSLSMGDRRKLLDAMVQNQPSPEMNLKLNCISCNEEMTLPLTWQDLFRYE